MYNNVYIGNIRQFEKILFVDYIIAFYYIIELVFKFQLFLKYIVLSSYLIKLTLVNLVQYFFDILVQYF